MILCNLILSKSNLTSSESKSNGLNFTNDQPRKLTTFLITFFAITLILQAPKPYNSLAYISDRVPSTPALEQKHYSSNDQINKYLVGTLESSQDSSTFAEGITVTILDYAEPLSPTREKGTFSISVC